MLSVLLKKIKKTFSSKPAISLLVLFIFIITFSKISLIGNGFFSNPDETRYVSSGTTLNFFLQGNITKGIKESIETGARPMGILLALIPFSIQAATATIFGLDLFELNNSYPLFIWNFIIYLLIILLHYKFSHLIFKDNMLALMSVLLLSTLTNSYIYIRHALGYDMSFLCFYYLFYYTIKQNNLMKINNLKSFLIGFFSFFGYLIYPGYLPLLGGLFITFFILSQKHHTIRKALRLCLFHGLGIIIFFILIEIFAQLGNTSYVGRALFRSNTITHGSFEESFSFLFKYLIDVENYSGGIIIIGLTLMLLLTIQKIIRNRAEIKPPIFILFITLSGIYIAYACLGYFFHKMVLYGRLLHQYFPFICIFTLFALSHYLNLFFKKKAHLIIMALCFIFIVDYVMKFREYTSYVYPRDIYFELFEQYNPKNIKEIHEYGSCDYWDVNPLTENKDSRFVTLNTANKDSIILVNGCYYTHIISQRETFEYKEFTPPKNYTLILSKPHFISSKVFQYEGCNIEDRKIYDQLDLHIKVYKKIK